jgi:hypothetical protein
MKVINTKFIIKRRWLKGCLLAFIYGCSSQASYKQLQPTYIDSVNTEQKTERAFETIKKYKPFIQQGDLLVRSGNDFTSESLEQLCATDKTYSHCGIVSIEHDSVFVYHALGGEWNPDEKLRRDPLELFCNPLENRGFGIFRFNFTDMQKNNLDSVVRSWHHQGLMFDMNFDLATDDRMYCAEFVSKAISTATKKEISFHTTWINNFEFVAVDNLFLNRHCRELYRIRYQ